MHCAGETQQRIKVQYNNPNSDFYMEESNNDLEIYF